MQERWKFESSDDRLNSFVALISKSITVHVYGRAAHMAGAAGGQVLLDSHMAGAAGGQVLLD